MKWSDPQNIYYLIPTIEIILTEWVQTISKHYIHQKEFAGSQVMILLNCWANSHLQAWLVI